MEKVDVARCQREGGGGNRERVIVPTSAGVLSGWIRPIESSTSTADGQRQASSHSQTPRDKQTQKKHTHTKKKRRGTCCIVPRKGVMSSIDTGMPSIKSAKSGPERPSWIARRLSCVEAGGEGKETRAADKRPALGRPVDLASCPQSKHSKLERGGGSSRSGTRPVINLVPFRQRASSRDPTECGSQTASCPSCALWRWRGPQKTSGNVVDFKICVVCCKLLS